MKFYISIIAGVIIIRADLLIVNHFAERLRPVFTRRVTSGGRC